MPSNLTKIGLQETILLKALILEDENRTAVELQQMLESLAKPVQVVGNLPSVAQAIKWFAANPMPDLVLADIHLQDGLCFELFDQLDLEIPVIFCTAYNQYALTAFDNNGIDYLLKPIDFQRLSNSIQKLYRIGERLNHVFTHQQQQTLQAQLINSYKQTLSVHYRSAILPLPVDQICYFHSSQNTVYIQTSSGNYHTKQPLDSIAQELNPADFYRANRNFLVHRKSILSMERLWTRQLKLNVSPVASEPVLITKAKATHFLRWIEGHLSN